MDYCILWLLGCFVNGVHANALSYLSGTVPICIDLHIWSVHNCKLLITTAVRQWEISEGWIKCEILIFVCGFLFLLNETATRTETREHSRDRRTFLRQENIPETRTFLRREHSWSDPPQIEIKQHQYTLHRFHFPCCIYIVYTIHF